MTSGRLNGNFDFATFDRRNRLADWWLQKLECHAVGVTNVDDLRPRLIA